MVGGLEEEFMVADESKALIHRYLDAISGKAKTEALLREYLGDEDLIRTITTFEAAFPRYELAVEDMLAEGDKVAVRATFRGTHEGELRGVAPSGKQVSFPVLIIYQVAAGKIIKAWLAQDTLSLAQQIGAVSPRAENVR
jgi:predicted ester cyclase